MSVGLPVLPVASIAPPADAATAAAKEAALVAWLDARGPVLVGYSGGVDSAYLAVVARRALGRDGVLAVIGRSASFPEAQWRQAREVAEAHDVPVLEVPTDELDDPSYAANPVNRCYFCKRTLWRHLVPVAAARGIRTIVDGTNADDLRDHRPGAAAADERGVTSPLAELGLTKAEIRVRSRELGLATWDRPSAPCLASRLPYGTAVTPERLALIERAEAALREAGIAGDLRVRHHGELARIEMEAARLDAWLAADRWPVLRALVSGAGYARVAVDLDGFRSGSLNVLGGVRREASRRGAEGAPMTGPVMPAVQIGALHVWQPDAAAALAAFATEEARATMAAAGRAEGITHVAVELPAVRP